jgi:hypothetical protein
VAAVVSMTFITESKADNWVHSPRLKIAIWKADKYLTADDEGPHNLIAMDDILGSVICMSTKVARTKCWVPAVV